jgi:hypothetical protein
MQDLRNALRHLQHIHKMTSHCVVVGCLLTPPLALLQPQVGFVHGVVCRTDVFFQRGVHVPVLMRAMHP